MTIQYSPEARRDLLAAKQYIVEHFFDQTAADNLAAHIVTSISRLKNHPRMGLPLSEKIDRKTELRYLVIPKHHMAFYRMEGDVIYIVRILDTRTDYIKKLF